MTSYLELVRWDWVREMKRKDTLVSMVLFALITLMVLSFAIVPDSETGVRARPGLLWVVLLLSASIGVDRAFRGEGQGAMLRGLLVAPVSRTTLYYAKITSTLLYIAVMEILAVTAFLLLYNVPVTSTQVLLLAAIVAGGTLGIVAAGVPLSAMTRSIRGGDVLMRILLFPLLIPVFYAVVTATAKVFEGREIGAREVVIVAAFDVIYLAAGQILFEPVVANFESS